MGALPPFRTLDEMGEDETVDGQEESKRLKRTVRWIEESAQSGASHVVRGSKVVGSQIVRASSSAAEQAARATAMTAAGVRRRMPRHEPGEPVRRAILDVTGTASVLAVEGDEDLESVALLSAQFLLADLVTSREQDEKRWERMERVLDRQRLALEELELEPEDAVGVLVGYGRGLSNTDRIAFLVDLYFLDPFAPYTLKSSNAVRHDAVDRVAVLVGGGDKIVGQIGETRKSAIRAHTNRALGRIGYIGIGAAIALGVAGFLAAPLVGAAIGTAAGLSGAAAVSHGLAILGGGALAAGGAGMAGGMWLVAGAGAAVGLVASGGGTALYELGSATARGELVKLQITFKLGILDANRDMAKAQRVITSLIEQADATRAVLEEERRLNEDNAQSVEDLEATLTDIEEAIGWMERERESTLESA